jgi:hypothetical protein
MQKRFTPSTLKSRTDARATSKVGAADSAAALIAERRKFIRPLPVPEVRESDTDSAWATFDALSGTVGSKNNDSSQV